MNEVQNKKKDKRKNVIWMDERNEGKRKRRNERGRLVFERTDNGR